MHAPPGNRRRNLHAAARAKERPLWLFLTEPGLGSLLGRELKFRDAVAQKTQFAKLHLRNYDLLIAPDAVVQKLSMTSRIASHILVCPVFGREKVSSMQLDQLASWCEQEGALSLVKSIAGEALSRPEFERFVARGLSERGIKLSGDGKPVWLLAVDEKYYFAFPRFNYHDAPWRQRSSGREGSLPAVVASAMVFAAKPGRSEVIWDPVMGTGTLLSEAQQMAQDARLIGSDIDAEAVRLAKQRLMKTDRVRLLHMDLERIRFEEAITLTLANLPFGKKFKPEGGTGSLYEALLRRSLRSAAENWRACLLTSDTDALNAAVESIGGLAIHEVAAVVVRGMRATISLVTRV
jgi:23S rRNA G2445 N2-methylase RlmL